MKILIASYGSRGDVQPYIALGKGLQKAGHQVMIATSNRFQAFIEEHGLNYGYMNDDLLSLIDTDQGKDLLEKTDNLFKVIWRTLSTLKQFGPMQQSLFDESWQAAKQFKPDVIVFHPKSYGCLHFAEKLSVPVALGLLVPMIVPTAEYPNIGFPKLKLGKRYNLMTYHLVNRLMKLSMGKSVKAWRAANDLPALRRFEILHTAEGKKIPVLHGISRHIVPEPADWPETSTMTGFWFLDRKDDWTPSPELEAFLQAGAPPVYVGFGSMAGRDPERLTTIVIEALQQAGVRGIIATGWGGMQSMTLPKTLFQIDQAPHDWLFPKMSAVVHHGGAGTTAAVLRAGKPSVIVPFFGDQPFWGAHVYAQGLGSLPIPQKKLTSEQLAASIQRVISSPDILKKSAEIGELIRQEDGVGTAVTIIEKLREPQEVLHSLIE